MTQAWRDRRLRDLFGIAAPIVQGPMAGAQDEALARGQDPDRARRLAAESPELLT